MRHSRMGSPIRFCRKTILRRLTLSRLRRPTLAWHLTVILIAASSFDEAGQFVPGEYVVGLLASIFLEKEAGAKIVHDPRVIWNTQDIVAQKGGIAVQSKTGHAFIKQTMRSMKRSTAARCRRIIISVTLPIATAA